ncbi:MAG: hypothetical protein JWN31_2174 [Frankiales bacterium]|nr:hypothetical protein [Frankiales bacterium]
MVDVTDYQAADVAVGKRLSALLTWRPLESWQTVLAAGVAVLMAAALSLVLTSPDPASAATFVTSVTHGEIVYADGTERAATIGAKLPGGASLRTGDGGGARITTDGRDVYIGALSTVTVVDGVHQTLQRGLVMIDAHSGPALTLATSVGAGTVNAPTGSLARVEQNVGTLRLAVYRAEASITAQGRQATRTVSALHQVLVPYGGVPESPTALALTIKNGVYDTWEQRLAADLVQADVDLNSFALGLNGNDGLLVISAAPASLRENLQGRRGEQALTVAVAQKARANAGDVSKNLVEVQRDRSDGGSWGVVAAIVRATVSDVTSVLGSSLDDPGNPTVIAIPRARQAGGEPQAAVTAVPTRTPGSTPSRRPTTRPTPGSTDPVQQAVNQVTGMLPPTPTPPVPTPTLAPAQPTVGTILTAVLGLLNP